MEPKLFKLFICNLSIPRLFLLFEFIVFYLVHFFILAKYYFLLKEVLHVTKHALIHGEKVL